MQILFLGPASALETVKTNLPLDYQVHYAIDEQEVDKILPSCDAILDAYMRVKFNMDRLKRASSLKLVVTATTGADHIDADYLATRSIPLMTLKGQREVLKNITPAAEHSWLLLMACARNLINASNHVKNYDWDRNKHPGIMLRGKTIGIIGCGRIGEWMSKYATAFGMRCIGYDPYVTPWPATIEKYEKLEELLPQADFISIHVNLSELTRGLIGNKELALTKPGAILINTSRGEIVDQKSLLSSLENGQLSGAGLDVLEGEPDIQNHPVIEYSLKHPNVIVTPHIGGFSPDAVNYTVAFSCNRIKEYFQQ